MLKRKQEGSTTNVFSPTFGYRSEYIVGRDKEISEFMESIAAAPGHPNRATFFIGQRGMGKTVLLDLAYKHLHPMKCTVAVHRNADTYGFIVRIKDITLMPF